MTSLVVGTPVLEGLGVVHGPVTRIGDTAPFASTGSGFELALNGDVFFPQCWEFRGGQAQLGFSLVQRLRIVSVSIQQDKSQTSDSAPRSLLLWGLIDGQEARDRYPDWVRSRLYSYLPAGIVSPGPKEHDYVPLALFQLNPRFPETQQFGIVFREAEKLEIPFGILVLQILDNWGADVTRLCGVGIQGIPWRVDHN
jgi:hypothetical protein